MRGKSGGQSGTEAGVLLFIPLKVGESGSLLVLSDKRASGNEGTSSPSSPEVLVSSWLRLQGGVLQQSSGRTMGLLPPWQAGAFGQVAGRKVH